MVHKKLGPLLGFRFIFHPDLSPVPRLIDIFFHTRLSLNSSSVDLLAIFFSSFFFLQPFHAPPLPTLSHPLRSFSSFRFVSQRQMVGRLARFLRIYIPA